MKTIILILVGAAGLAVAGDWKADFMRRYVVIQAKPAPKPAVVDPEVLKQAIIQPPPAKLVVVLPPAVDPALLRPVPPVDVQAITERVARKYATDQFIAETRARQQRADQKSVVDAIEAKTAEVLDELSAMRRAEEVRRLEQQPVIIIRGK